MTSALPLATPPKAYFAHLIDCANRYPDALALCSDSGMTSLSDLVGNAVSAAKVLRSKNVRGRRTVCLQCRNADLNYVLALSLMMNGCRVGYAKALDVYADLGVKIDLVLTDQPGKVGDHPTMQVKQEWFQPKKPISTLGLSIAQDFSAIFSSSGSTGRPKLIEFSAHAILHRVITKGADSYMPVNKRFMLTAGRGSLSVVADSLVALTSGGVLVQPSGNTVEAILAAIQRYCPNYLLIAPALLAEIVESLRARPIKTRVPVARVTGAYCPPQIAEAALEVLVDEIVTSYGATEVGRIAWKTTQHTIAEDRCAGHLIDGIDAAAFGDQGQCLPPGQAGQIMVRPAPEVVGTYIGTKAEVSSALIDGWFPTGDVGKVLEDGKLIILGRSSAVINYAGNKLHPNFMERVLLSMDGVTAVAVAGVDGPDGFPRICAAVVAPRPIALDAANWHLVQTDFEFPVHVVKQVDALPMLESGKLDRRGLAGLFADAVDVPMIVTVPDQS